MAYQLAGLPRHPTHYHTTVSASPESRDKQGTIDWETQLTFSSSARLRISFLSTLDIWIRVSQTAHASVSVGRGFQVWKSPFNKAVAYINNHWVSILISLLLSSPRLKFVADSSYSETTHHVHSEHGCQNHRHQGVDPSQTECASLVSLASSLFSAFG